MKYECIKLNVYMFIIMCKCRLEISKLIEIS